MKNEIDGYVRQNMSPIEHIDKALYMRDCETGNRCIWHLKHSSTASTAYNQSSVLMLMLSALRRI